jgi:hypothetical protein
VIRRAVAAAALWLLCTPAPAFDISTGADLQLRWDNTVKYSAAWRVRDQSATLLANVNGDDGDRNFARGLISNRLDVLSELDLTYQQVGARFAGAAWYDTLYNRSNANDSPGTANSVSVAHNGFTGATTRLHGRQAEVLDAFVFGNATLGGVPASVRLGRHTLLWGESLLMADNGISYAQAPLDAIKGSRFQARKRRSCFFRWGRSR